MPLGDCARNNIEAIGSRSRLEAVWYLRVGIDGEGIGNRPYVGNKKGL